MFDTKILALAQFLTTPRPAPLKLTSFAYFSLAYRLAFVKKGNTASKLKCKKALPTLRMCFFVRETYRNTA